jgi:hypothetical protein
VGLLTVRKAMECSSTEFDVFSSLGFLHLMSLVVLLGRFSITDSGRDALSIALISVSILLHFI